MKMLGSQFGSKSFGAGLVKGLEKNSVKAKKEQNKKKSKVQMMMNQQVKQMKTVNE